MSDREVIMSVGGHVGDAELTSGGVLATLALKGYKIITVALTGGERGTPEGMTVADYRIQKEKEAKEFAEMLNGEAIVFPYVDGELPVNDDIKFELCDLIRKHKPKMIFTHWKNSIHKDHEATYKIVRDAQFYAGLPSIEREDKAHYVRGPYYSENWEDPVDFEKYVFMEVSKEGYELWKKAISLHWFTVNSTSFKYKEYYKNLMKVNGILARKEYAEAYNIDSEKKRVIMGLEDF